MGNFDDHPGLLALNTETNQLAYIDSNGNVIGEIVDPSVNPLYTAIFNQLADPGSFGLDAVPSSSPQSWSGCPLGIYPAWLTTHTKVPQAIGNVNFQTPFALWSYVTSYQDSCNNIITLKLLKDINETTPNSPTWPLMFKNVYSLGGTNIDPNGIEIEVVRNLGGTDERTHSEEGNSYLSIFDLDKEDEKGVAQRGYEFTEDSGKYFSRRGISQ